MVESDEDETSKRRTPATPDVAGKLPVEETVVRKSPIKELVEKGTETKAEGFIATAMVIQSEVMNFIDNIPNKKLSKDNRKMLREYMADFMSVITRQQAVMSMIVGKCHGQTNLIEDKLENFQNTNEESIQMNFAAATKI
ncbi:hypothetical protein AVEN_228543-1 [Araneus ventricosus]|uniref:Uncharacterized protein n=1 Tax=Araneus ventricosus TaxID=182803 RepID=A0A4Y2UGT5_ARAVE|nr:hypothetical protein AVEN_228543-1 [Araneus ventricosus]